MSSSPDSFQSHFDSHEPKQELDSPFLNEAFFVDEETEAASAWGTRLNRFQLDSPFLRAFEEGWGAIAELEGARFDEQLTPKEATMPVLSLDKLKMPGLSEITLKPGSSGQYEGFFREPPSVYNGTVKLSGRVQIEEAGTLRDYDYARDRSQWPLRKVWANVGVYDAIEISGSSESPIERNGTFTTISPIVYASKWIDYKRHSVRRFTIQVTVESKTGKRFIAKVVVELIDLAGFLAIVDPKEKTRPSWQTHLEFLASVRKIYHGGPREPQFVGSFNQVLYRHRDVEPLFKFETPEERRLRLYKILYDNGEWLEIGHVLCGIEGSPKQEPNKGQSVPIPIRPDLIVTWSGDLGSALQRYIQHFWLATDKDGKALDKDDPLDLNYYLVKEASRSDLIGDIDGINIGSTYDSKRSLAENLNAYYGKKSRRRYHEFIANSKNERGMAELPLVLGKKPPKLSKQSRQTIAIHTHGYLKYLWVLGQLYYGTEQAKRKRVDDIMRVDSNLLPLPVEIEKVVDYFVRFLEDGLALEQRQGVISQPEVEESDEFLDELDEEEWEEEAEEEGESDDLVRVKNTLDEEEYFEFDVPQSSSITRDYSLKSIADGTLGNAPKDIRAEILTKGNHDAKALTNQVFWQLHLDLKDTQLSRTDPKQQKLRDEWSRIFHQQINPLIWFHRIIELLDKHRADIPREFLLGWMAVESDGSVKVISTRGERGYFQIDWKGGEAQEQLKLSRQDFNRLSTDRKFSIQIGVQLVQTYRRFLLDNYKLTDGTDLLWHLTKARHGASGTLKFAMDKLVNAGKDITWSVVSQEMSDTNVGRKVVNNVNEMFRYASLLKPIADLIPSPPVPTPELLISESDNEWNEEELDVEREEKGAITQFFNNEWELETEAFPKFLDELDEEDPDKEIEEEEKPENKFKNCSNLQKNRIQTVSNWARQAITRAATVVGSAYGRPDRMSPRTGQVLNKHFRTTDRDHLREILLKLRSIQKAFEEGVSFKCEAKCDPVMGAFPCGYAKSSQWFGGFGDVHICFDSRPNGCDFTNLSAYNQTALIIHEVAHRYVGIRDQAYFRDSQQAYFDMSGTRVRLDAKSAMNNADSYAYFSLDL